MLLIRNQTKKTASNLTVTAHMCSSDSSKWNWPFSVTSTVSMIQIFCNNNIMKSLPKLSIIWQSYKAVQRMFVEICFWRFKSRLSDTMKVIVNVPTNIQFWRKNNHGQQIGISVKIGSKWCRRSQMYYLISIEYLNFRLNRSYSTLSQVYLWHFDSSFATLINMF